MTDPLDSLLREEFRANLIQPSRNLMDRSRVERELAKRRSRIRGATFISLLVVLALAVTAITGSFGGTPSYAEVPGPNGNVTVPYNSQSGFNNAQAKGGGWGPLRTAYTYHHPPSSGPVLDSVLNSPAYGDEENFVTGWIKPATGSSAQAGNILSVTPGDQVIVRAYINNDSTGGGSPSAGRNNAKGVFVKFAYDAGRANGFDVVGILNGANVHAEWDAVALNDPQQSIRLVYVPGSATLFSFNRPPQKLSDAIVNVLPSPAAPNLSTGVSIGSSGIVKPGWRNALCVLITLRVVAG